MGLKDAIFNKGGIGKSFDRQETARRTNEVLRQQVELNHSYRYLVQNSADAALVEELEPLLYLSRGDVAKLGETILSAGHIADYGTDIEPEDVTLPGGEVEMIRAVQEQEESLLEKVTSELNEKKPPHQIRTKAILQNVATHSQERLNVLERASRETRRRPAST